MPQPHPLSRVLPALACLLALLAGGDDFNLARVVLPLPGPLSEATLPLDDPNTDFTKATRPSGRVADDPLPPARPPAPALVSPGPSAPLALGPAGPRPANTPLRC
jgi:hypothetical protein